MTLTFKQTKQIADEAGNYFYEQADLIRKQGGFLGMQTFEMNNSDWAFIRLGLLLETATDLKALWANRHNIAETAKQEEEAEYELDELNRVIEWTLELIAYAQLPEDDGQGVITVDQAESTITALKNILEAKHRINADSIDYTQVMVRLAKDAGKHLQNIQFAGMELEEARLDYINTAIANSFTNLEIDTEVAPQAAPAPQAEVAINELDRIFQTL
jgi:hypothetical protein